MGTMTEGEAVALIHKADKDGNKGIDQSEFAELWNALHGGGEAEAKIREEFSKLDTDKSGFISKDEMLTVISGSFTGDKQAEAQRCVAELDVDKDGKVSYPEFLLVMKYKKAQTTKICFTRRLLPTFNPSTSFLLTNQRAETLKPSSVIGQSLVQKGGG